MKKWLSSSGILALLLLQMSVQPSYGQGSSILFKRAEDPNIYSINPDGTNLTVVTEGTNPVLSPDRQSILINRGGTMWIVPLDGSMATMLVLGLNYVWSPDGQQIVFQIDGNIYLINKDGSGERRVGSVGGVRFLYLSPSDPLWVYYTNGRSTDTSDIFRVNVATGEERLVREFTSIAGPDPFSPDGTRLLVSDCSDGNSCAKVLNLATGELMQKYSGAQRPVWSPDGSRIVFTKSDGIGGLHLADLNGQVVTELVPGRTESAPVSAVWSPNGDMIAFSMKDWGGTQKSQLYLVNADGSGMRQLTEGFPVAWRPSEESTSTQTSSWGQLKSQ